MGFEVIKELAKQKNVSLECIANHAGISYNSLSKIIRNTIKEPKYSTLKNIAEALGMNIDELSYAIEPVGLPPHMLKSPFNATNQEQNLIEKYRLLDSYGTDMVDTVLNKEYSRCAKGLVQKENKIVSIDNTPDYLKVNAAHQRTDKVSTPEGKQHDDNIMNDDSEWE